MKAPLQTYFYISERKVETYHPQVPKKLLQGLKAKITATLGIVKAEVSTDGIPTPELHEKLRRVVSYIENNYEVGTIEFPSEWNYDEMIVRHMKLPDNPDIMLLIGKKKNTTTLLAGSAHHIVGSKRPETSIISYSFLPSVAEQLGKVGDLLDSHDTKWFEVWRSMIGKGDSPVGVSDHEFASVIHTMNKRAVGIEFQIRFLGQNFFSYEEPQYGKVIALSPLFVTID